MKGGMKGGKPGKEDVMAAQLLSNEADTGLGISMGVSIRQRIAESQTADLDARLDKRGDESFVVDAVTGKEGVKAAARMGECGSDRVGLPVEGAKANGGRGGRGVGGGARQRVLGGLAAAPTRRRQRLVGGGEIAGDEFVHVRLVRQHVGMRAVRLERNGDAGRDAAAKLKNGG
ncbi:hypothetical protein CDD82_6646 [Ophiocordyceps australis]|uniref:Uncharacterized protein n=1 Tax=Ophiocordyceps australis TaxID=1399860 RepID=A0A2C5ZMD3_9HYPO|nr:hypothetical protein CDD82_6646 [Ophiocordyceps australis]